jgi:predicted acetylornithine/succinylornithine family transaminase
MQTSLDRQVIQAEATYLLQTYVRPEIVLERGEGVYLVDSNGRRYLDFMGGIAVVALGHSDPEWVAAVSEQAATLAHVSNLFHTAPQVGLARRLVENSFADRVFLANTGTEANEAALKFARKWATTTSGNANKTEIVAFSGSFHGRSMGALSTTYKEQYRRPFEPLIPGIRFARFNDLASAGAEISASTCAVIVEPIQGEGGVYPATADFLAGLRVLCDRHQALLIFDEIQCGLGRTGCLWAHEAYGVTPDVMTLAKPLAGGLPIGATLLTQRVADAIKPGDHGSTFAGGPLVCCAAQVVFDRVNDPRFLAHVREMGDFLKARLQALPSTKVVAVRQAGLLCGVELNTAAAPVIAAARDRGLLVINAGEQVLRLAPPLIIEPQQIDEAVTILAACLGADPVG